MQRHNGHARSWLHMRSAEDKTLDREKLPLGFSTAKTGTGGSIGSPSASYKGSRRLQNRHSMCMLSLILCFYLMSVWD